MPTFGLITEGVTDQQVIQAILEGFFDSDEIDIRPFLPIADSTYKHQTQSFSNWELVLAYCASPNFEQAFPFVDYIVVQLDTDKCEEPNFGVPKFENGESLSPQEIVTRVVEKLKERIGDPVWNRYEDRILFAVAVETTECWLLPLYAVDRDKSKHLNCLDVLNRALRKKNRRPINPQDKKPQYYRELVHPYRKRRDLMSHCTENPSLAVFVEQLKTVFDDEASTSANQNEANP